MSQAPRVLEEGEVGDPEPVTVVEAAELEVQPEGAEQALALNADGLRFWLNEVSPETHKPLTSSGLIEPHPAAY